MTKPVEVIVVEEGGGRMERIKAAIARMQPAPASMRVAEATAPAINKAIAECPADAAVLLRETDIPAIDLLAQLSYSEAELASASVLFRSGNGFSSDEHVEFSIFRKAIPVADVRDAGLPLTDLTPQGQVAFLLAILGATGRRLTQREYAIVFACEHLPSVDDRPSLLEAAAHAPFVFSDLHLGRIAAAEMPRDIEAAVTVLNAVVAEYAESGDSIGSYLRFFEAVLLPVYDHCVSVGHSPEAYVALRKAFDAAQSKGDAAVLKIMTGADSDTIACLHSLEYDDFSRYMQLRALQKELA